MSGKSTVEKQQTQTQNATTAPWAPTQGLLSSIIGQYGGQNTGVTGDQSAALTGLLDASRNIQSFLPQATGVANDLVGSTANHAGILSDVFQNYQNVASPYLTGQYVDPNSNPYLKGALETARGDVTRTINDQFAAAGRDLSPAHATALARGITQAEEPLLLGQYNTNVGTQRGVLSDLFGAGSATATGLTGLDQTAIGNQLQGLNIGGSLGQFATAPGQTLLNAANAAYAQPYQNIGMLTQGILPIAALGSQSSGTSNTTGSTTQSSDPFSNIIGGVTGGLGILGSTGAFGNTGWLKGLFSDRRIKDDIAPVGALFDGTPVYRFRYKGDPIVRVGLMAQDVEKTNPDAVFDVAGIKAVDYGLAVARSEAFRHAA